MQGIFLSNYERPKSKAALKKAIAAGDNIILEATSMFNNEYGGGLDTAPDGQYTFVGPCPFTKRNFYGVIHKSLGKVVVK